MASGDTDYLENKLLDHVLGGGDYTRPATLYVALTTTQSADGSGGTEPSGNGYARVAVTNNATNFPAASAGAKSNGVLIDFGAPTGSTWGTVLCVEIWDASSGGNRIKWGDLTTSKATPVGDPVQFPIASLAFTQD